MKDYQLIRIDDATLVELEADILKLCDKELGQGLYNLDRMAKICKESHHYFYCVQKEQKTVGVFYCFAETVNKTELWGKIDQEYISADTKIGIAQSIALSDEVKGTGMSKFLLQYGTKLLFENERVEAILVPAWMKNGKVPASKHLEECGYSLMQVVEKLWASYETLRCPVCGTVPCSCDGAIYVKWKKV